MRVVYGMFIVSITSNKLITHRTPTSEGSDSSTVSFVLALVSCVGEKGRVRKSLSRKNGCYNRRYVYLISVLGEVYFQPNEVQSKKPPSTLSQSCPELQNSSTCSNQCHWKLTIIMKLLSSIDERIAVTWTWKLLQEFT